MAPPLGGSSGGLPSRLGYLSLQGVLLPRVYGTIASPPWLELRGLSALQALPTHASQHADRPTRPRVKPT